MNFKYLNDNIRKNERRILNRIKTTGKISPESKEMKESIDVTRDMVSRKYSQKVAKNPLVPISPITCSGTSFECNVPGSGKQPMKELNMHTCEYDHLATPIQEGGMLNTNFEPDFILNWNNNSVETKYTKDSLKATYGFENFQ